MVNCTRALLVLILLCEPGMAQSTTRPKFFDRAHIEHGEAGVTVTANESLPLFQAIDAVRLEYGWQVNWESAPCYSHFDVVDDTAPKWRAAHPNEKGVTRPAGGLYVGTFPEPKETSDLGAERLALSRLVEEYNATDNPGKYTLRADPGGQLTIVGTRVRDETGNLQDIRPLLDTPLTIGKEPRSVYDAIKSILAGLESATGKQVLFAAASSSLFRTTQATIGGEGVPARELLMQALASTERPIQYDLSFDPDVPTYILGVSPAMREENDGTGGHRLVSPNRVAKP
jgi:hypothetical protein